MNYRRYYPKGSKKFYVLSDEQFNKMVDDLGFEHAIERDNACIELIPETKEEMLNLFFSSCEKVIANTRWYLDNLDKVPTFTIKYGEFYEYLEKNSPKPKSL